MKRFVAFLLSLTLVNAIGVTASSAAPLPMKKFKNCTALRKTYPGGVAKSRSSQNLGGEISLTPKVSASIYKQNKNLDRDKDGIACEK